MKPTNGVYNIAEQAEKYLNEELDAETLEELDKNMEEEDPSQREVKRLVGQTDDFIQPYT